MCLLPNGRVVSFLVDQSDNHFSCRLSRYNIYFVTFFLYEICRRKTDKTHLNCVSFAHSVTEQSWMDV